MVSDGCRESQEKCAAMEKDMAQSQQGLSNTYQAGIATLNNGIAKGLSQVSDVNFMSKCKALQDMQDT